MYPRKIRQLLDDFLIKVGDVQRLLPDETMDRDEYEALIKIIRNQADD